MFEGSTLCLQAQRVPIDVYGDLLIRTAGRVSSEDYFAGDTLIVNFTLTALTTEGRMIVRRHFL